MPLRATARFPTSPWLTCAHLRSLGSVQWKFRMTNIGLFISNTKHDSEVSVNQDVMVTMRDGVRLATDIYFPVVNGERISGVFPVILERTPYGKAVESRSECSAENGTALNRPEVADFFVRQGYVVIYQDCRGRHGSEGTFTKYLSEANDGYDTCAWIVQQPWCNGRIGTKGLSYAAHTQVALASVGAPGVAAMIVDSGGFSNGYQSGIRQGGAFELKQASWAIMFAKEHALKQGGNAASAALSIDIADWFKRMPWRRGNSPLSVVPEFEDFLFDQWERGEFGEYWKQPGIYAEGFYDKLCGVASVQISSWYDPYTRSAVENFVGLAKKRGTAVRLILGPWTHGNRWLTYAGDVDFGPQAIFDGNVAPDFLTFRLQWFDRFLKRIDDGIDADSPVLLFVMGGGTGRKNSNGRMDHGGCWRAERHWPIPTTSWTPYYLQSDGWLSQHEPPSESAALGYNFDPRNPVPTIGGTVVSREPATLAGAFDQCEAPQFFGCKPPYRRLAQRSDVLVFQTLPLLEDVEVTGPIVIHLWISSDCVDTDFTAKLIDWHAPTPDYPEGYAMNLTDGILRARYRDSWSNPTLMTPGDIYPIRIEAFPTSNLFKRGHRIRLDISSSNFPHFDVNPNTGEPEAGALEMRVAHNRVFIDRAHPSHVVLPVIPKR